MTSDAVLYERRDNVGLITFNRGDNRNSMTPELLDGFSAKVAEVKADHDVRCVVITGSGSCFSAGADFNSQIQRQDDKRPRAPHEKSYAMYEPFLSVLDIEVPVIGALNGHAVGGGFGLSLVCDIRIGERSSKYGANFVKLGLSPGMAVTYLLPRLIGVARAAELLFTGKLIRGAEAEQIGLVGEALDGGDAVLEHALSLAADIASAAPFAVRATKKMLYKNLDWRPRDGALAESFPQAESIATEDAAEGIRALLEKRPPAFVGR